MRLARPASALRLEPQLRQSQSRILPPTRGRATFHLLRLAQSTHTHAQCCRTVHFFPPFCGSFPFHNFACAITPAPTAACRRLQHDSLSAHYIQLITPVADCSMISATTQTRSSIYKHCTADTIRVGICWLFYTDTFQCKHLSGSPYGVPFPLGSSYSVPFQLTTMHCHALPLGSSYSVPFQLTTMHCHA